MPESRPRTQYRQTKELPFNLNERIRVALEETLYPQALESLASIITPGVSTPSPPPAFVPPHTHIRLITTLITHPYLTTQLSKNEPIPTAPISAFLLLRRILRLIGPLNTDFQAAWHFTDTRRRGGARGHKALDSTTDDTSLVYTTDDHLASELVTTDSLFSNAEDLWSVLGWAFTCSVSHPTRWRWWKLETTIILDVLERDWEDRLTSARATNSRAALEKALIVRMLPDTTGSAGYKKVIRAILANGSASALHGWPEVYKSELSTKRPKKRNIGSLDNTFLGDSDSDAAVEDQTDGDTPMDDLSDSDSDQGMPTAVGEWGGMDSVVLRQRWLTLLSSVAYHGCYISIATLYQEYNETIHRLPIGSFMLFTSTLLDAPVAYRSSLNQLLLGTIISSRAPRPGRNDGDELTVWKMVEWYLPYPANSGSLLDNCKVAVLVETLMRISVLEKDVGMQWSEEVERAVEVGIEARKRKAVLGRRGERAAEAEVKAVWEGAEERLRGWVGMLRERDGVME